MTRAAVSKWTTVGGSGDEDSGWPSFGGTDLRTMPAAMRNRWATQSLFLPALFAGWIFAACSNGSVGSTESTVALTVRFGSHLQIVDLAIESRWGNQRVEASQSVLEHIGPPGERAVSARLTLPTTAAGETVRIVVTGRTQSGETVAQGAVTVVPQVADRVATDVVLGRPDLCGDGIVRTDECDDGNLTNGDGCSSDCTVEPDFQCGGSPSQCSQCGNGVREGLETCDDGNLTNGDGCDAQCRLPGVATAWTATWQYAELSAEATAFADVQSIELGTADSARLVFVSGIITGDGPAIVQARLVLDGTVVDRFGHDLRGSAEGGGGGVMSYFPLPAGAPATLTIQLQATAGVARWRNVRVVAAAMPPGADLRQVNADDELDRVGAPVSLDALELPAGRYLVLAKMSLTEAPGEHTARGWLEGPDGRRQPLDETGVTFSASRDSLSPLWTTAVVEAPSEGATVRLGGNSSGSNATLSDWVEPEAGFRLPLQVAGPTEAGYAVRVTFDHASQVAAGRARADGSDALLVHRPTAPNESPTRIDRVLDPDSAWNRSDTTIWFRVEETVDVDGSDRYALYFGGPVDERSDPSAVFLFHDDFATGALDPVRWQFDEDPVVSFDDGLMTVDGAARLVSQTPFGPDGVRWEASLRMLADAPVDLTYLGAGAFVDFATAFDGAALAVVDLLHRAVTPAATTPVAIDTPLAFHRYSISRLDPQTVVFGQDDETLATLAGDAADPAWNLQIDNAGPTGAVYDWVRVRPYQSPEPVVSVGGLQGTAGVFPSRFRFRRIAAVRLDAWAAAHVASGQVDATRTNGPYRPVAALNLPAAEGERLVMQSVRVSGDNDAAARRRGIARVDGREILVTGHRLDRDDSDRNGYHHVAGAVHVLTATAAPTLEVGIDSPEGIEVTGADGRIVVLDYPR